MTQQELERKYMNRFLDEEKVSETFTHMGKFGRTTLFMFTFTTENATVRTELCVKGGRLIGFTPEKEPLQDDWGYTAEDFTEEITAEEYARIGRYFESVTAE